MSDLIKEISIDLIDDPTLAMRGNVQDEDIDSLAASIKQVGLLEPLVVRVAGERFELVAGHRRLTALRRLGKVIVSAKCLEVSEDEAMTIRIHENSHRLDVNPVDDAVYIGHVMVKLGYSAAQMAEKMNRSVGFIYDRLAILEFPEYLVTFVAEKKISVSAAMALNKISDEVTKRNFCEIAAKDGITLERANAWVSMASIGAISQDTTSEQLQALAEPELHNQTLISCARCKQGAKLGDMVTVWIHKVCPDGSES